LGNNKPQITNHSKLYSMTQTKPWLTARQQMAMPKAMWKVTPMETQTETQTETPMETPMETRMGMRMEMESQRVIANSE
jgi:hypothetical protein